MDRLDLVARAASLYYEQGLTQTEIAKRIHTSRSTVSRLLQEGRDKGIVEIIVHYPHKRHPHYEKRLCQRFGLDEARVLVGRDRPYEDTLRRVGSLGASYLTGLIEPDMVLAISWGTSVYSTVKALQPDGAMPITVVQMIGAAGTEDPLIDGPDLARLVAGVYGGRALYVHAPLLVESADVRDGLLQDVRIRETLSIARGADIALVGIGTVAKGFSSWLRAGYLQRDALDGLEARGAVGDICGWHFDAQGRVLDIDVNHRIVGIELQALHAIDRVVGVAVGEIKAPAILGALRGRHIDVLVTDEGAARKLLASEDGGSTSDDLHMGTETGPSTA